MALGSLNTIYASIVGIGFGDTIETNRKGVCRSLREILHCVSCLSLSEPLTPSQRLEVRRFMDNRIAKVLGNVPARIARFERLPMYRSTIEALDPPRIIDISAAQFEPGADDYDRAFIDPGVIARSSAVGGIGLRIEREGQ